MLRKVLQAVLIFSLSLFAAASYALPLSTRSRWIVDSTSGNRVKLKCINWAAHMQTMLAEGLDKKPLSDVASQVSSLGFNCVRLTWATFMFTRPEYSNLGVAESLKTLGLVEAMRGLEENNPSFMNLTVLEAYVAVVDVLGKHELMVVVDNHVSMPMWCCRDNDGNGFFGDRFFTPREWLKGLIMVAKQFKGKKQVVGMSLRNELRGPHQNLLGWYRYLKYAARRIHDENPHVLVILGGLNYCTRLDFLKKRPFGGNLDNKLVYEAHWYSFTGGDRQKWKVNTLSQVCDKTTQAFNNLAVFVTKGEKPVPLFLSEFGVDERGTGQADNRFLSCFLAFATENDMDWAIWALQGTYYLKNGHPEFDETYGVLDGTWNHLRNPNFRERFQLMQQTLQGMIYLISTY
ncbi:Glycoside hydrolase, family 5 [Dillenia turbinata]|uniref:Glycoside hydrolase, family 5 n=1 Tax=Dillenia turbinata TaxID=194707 RepID=A0AAN8VBY6_9MAGN